MNTPVVSLIQLALCTGAASYSEQTTSTGSRQQIWTEVAETFWRLKRTVTTTALHTTMAPSTSPTIVTCMCVYVVTRSALEFAVKPKVHDATGCTTCCIVYTNTQAVVQPFNWPIFTSRRYASAVWYHGSVSDCALPSVVSRSSVETAERIELVCGWGLSSMVGYWLASFGAWTKSPYVGPGYYWDGWLSAGGYTISVCNQPTGLLSLAFLRSC